MRAVPVMFAAFSDELEKIAKADSASRRRRRTYAKAAVGAAGLVGAGLLGRRLLKRARSLPIQPPSSSVPKPSPVRSVGPSFDMEKLKDITDDAMYRVSLDSPGGGGEFIVFGQKLKGNPSASDLATRSVFWKPSGGITNRSDMSALMRKGGVIADVKPLSSPSDIKREGFKR